MKLLFRRPLLAAGVFAILTCAASFAPPPALAGTTGNITGTLTDASGKPVADVRVTAAAPSQTLTTHSDAHGFYSLVNLIPDTYTVSFEKSGYQALSVPGITVVQDQTVTLNQQMRTELKTIAAVTAVGSSNLVKPGEGTDVYTVTGAQLSAASNPVGALQTIYEWMAVTPGVTANGFPAQPRVRGGQVTDLGYEFEGIPIQDRMVGFFTTNLSNTGLANVEVYTGGLAGAGAVNGTGYFNSVLKTGTYPGFTTLSIQATSPEFNNYLTFEHGGATPDKRFSYYVGFTGVNSQNQYNYGDVTYPGVVFGFDDGPGPVKERNWVGNFHYRPNPNNDIQVVVTNDYGQFNFNYLLTRSSGEPLPLAVAPCPGATSSWVPGAPGNFPNNAGASGGPSTGTYATGGVAPNGQPCPLGIYWSPLGNGQGNIWNHYGGLGKIQWNHNINDHSFFDLRLDENFNQYIFDQPIADPNIPSLENPGGGWNQASDFLGLPGNACPLYPYQAGTPVAAPAGDPFDMCVWGDGTQVFYGDRRSNIWEGAVDYTNALSDKVTLKAGVSHEYDRNVFDYENTHVFTIVPNGTPTGALRYPGLFEGASYPTNQQIAYFNPELHFGKFMISPGLTYAQRHYGFPADTGYIGSVVNGHTLTAGDIYSGGYTAHALDPTVNGTYTFDPSNVISFSYGDTTSFIGSVYVYTNSLAQFTGFDGLSTTRNPFAPGTSFVPQLNHAAELLWEHNFGDNTTMRVGPWYNGTTNYYESVSPLLGYTSSGVPIFSKQPILTNGQEHHALGAEFGLNHVNNGTKGTSFWLSATYDNFWTSSYDLPSAYVNVALPQSLVTKGILVRAPSNPIWTATLLADYHSNRFHLDPLVYYQGDTFFNVGDVVSCVPATFSNSHCVKDGGTLVAPYFATTEGIAHGWWKVNLMAYEELGVKRNFIVGLKVDNFFDNVTDTAPCPSIGTGCYPFYGPFSGIIDTPSTNYHPSSASYGNPNWIYQNYSQDPRTFYFFAGVKL